MSLVSVIKEIKNIKNQILELRLMGNTNLEKEKEKEQKLLYLEEAFKLQKQKNISRKKNLQNITILDTSESYDNNFINENIDEKIDFPDDFTIAKEKLTTDFNNLMNLRDEKRKYKKSLI